MQESAAGQRRARVRCVVAFCTALVDVGGERSASVGAVVGVGGRRRRRRVARAEDIYYTTVLRCALLPAELLLHLLQLEFLFAVLFCEVHEHLGELGVSGRLGGQRTPS